MAYLTVCKDKEGKDLQRCLKKEMPKVIGYHVGAPHRNQKNQRGWKGTLREINQRVTNFGFDDATTWDVQNASRGIAWGESTGRTTGSVWWKLEHMKDKDVVDLVSEIAKKGMGEGDVPRYLNKKFPID